MSELVTYSLDLYGKIRDQLEGLVRKLNLVDRDFLNILEMSGEDSHADESMGQVRDLENLCHQLAWLKEIFNTRLQEINDLKINDNHAAEIDEMVKKHAAGIIAEVKKILQVAEEKTILALEYFQRELAVMEPMIKDLEERIQAAKMAGKHIKNDYNNNVTEIATPIESDDILTTGDPSCAEVTQTITSGPAHLPESRNNLQLSGGTFAIITGSIFIAVGAFLITARQALAGTIILITGVTIALL